MKRRITAAILVVAALILVGLGLPLAVVEQHAIQRAALLRLETEATHTLGQVELPLGVAQLRALDDQLAAPSDLSVYDSTGRLLYGLGPSEPDGVVGQALQGATTSAAAGELEVATPILDEQGQITGVLRLSNTIDATRSQAHQAWLIMAAASAVALGLGWVVASLVARTISAPVTDIAAIAIQSRQANGVVAYPRSGIAEVDHLAEALERSARRIDESLQRERRFSSDVSHQLRTPLAALRLRLERLDNSGGALDAEAALSDLDRIEATVGHLLALSRDALPTAPLTDPVQAVEAAVARWAGPATSKGRVIRGEADARGDAVAISSVALDQILDVLVDNALVHGTGVVTVRVRALAGGTAVDVADEGSCRPDTASTMFERREGRGTGIGLDLARTLAEADGAGLTLSRLSPTTFSVIVLHQEL